MQEGAGPVGEHDSRAVVVGEDDGAFVRPGRDQDVAGPDAPYPLAAERGRGLQAEVVGAPLQRQHEPVVVVPEGGGALQVQHVGIGGQLGDRGRDPLQGGRAVDGVGAAEQRAARLALLVDEHHPGAGARRGQCRGQPRRAGTDHQQIGVHMCGVVAGGVGDLGQPALPGMPRATSPSNSSMVVASSIGSGNGSSIWIRPPVSSAHAAVMPRGRPSLMLVLIWWMPLASNAEARVSPACPVSSRPSKVKVCVGRGRCDRRWGVRNGAFTDYAGFCSSTRYTRWNR